MTDLVEEDGDALGLGKGGVDRDTVVVCAEGSKGLAGCVGGADEGACRVERCEEAVEGGESLAGGGDVGGEGVSRGVIGIVEAASLRSVGA